MKNIEAGSNLRYFNNRNVFMICRIPSRFFILLIVSFLSFICYSQEKTTIRTIVIDAGHGGKDPGTIGRKTHEKDITLAIALKVGEQIQTHASHFIAFSLKHSDNSLWREEHVTRWPKRPCAIQNR